MVAEQDTDFLPTVGEDDFFFHISNRLHFCRKIIRELHEFVPVWCMTKLTFPLSSHHCDCSPIRTTSDSVFKLCISGREFRTLFGFLRCCVHCSCFSTRPDHGFCPNCFITLHRKLFVLKTQNLELSEQPNCSIWVVYHVINVTNAIPTSLSDGR